MVRIGIVLYLALCLAGAASQQTQGQMDIFDFIVVVLAVVIPTVIVWE
jgi:hypothetical protein